MQLLPPDALTQDHSCLAARSQPSLTPLADTEFHLLASSSCHLILLNQIHTCIQAHSHTAPLPVHVLDKIFQLESTFPHFPKTSSVSLTDKIWFPSLPPFLIILCYIGKGSWQDTHKEADALLLHTPTLQNLILQLRFFYEGFLGWVHKKVRTSRTR